MLDATRDQMSSAERRASTLRAELEELKALFERVNIFFKFSNLKEQWFSFE